MGVRSRWKTPRSCRSAVSFASAASIPARRSRGRLSNCRLGERAAALRKLSVDEQALVAALRAPGHAEGERLDNRGAAGMGAHGVPELARAAHPRKDDAQPEREVEARVGEALHEEPSLRRRDRVEGSVTAHARDRKRSAQALAQAGKGGLELGARLGAVDPADTVRLPTFPGAAHGAGF